MSSSTLPSLSLKPYFYPGFRNAGESFGNQILEKTGLLNDVTTKESSIETLEDIESTKASEASPVNAEGNEDIQNLITIRQPIFIVSTSGLSQVIVLVLFHTEIVSSDNTKPEFVL